ncbi:EAL domain-containing protein [Synechococcus sp. HK05]|uniref:putative bifunctional diguanylate cyclase/phosphodiesterase n=1 Tax=Synechococcus sp. HK05 TaxID=2725975 RepID=UPI001C38D732|nr:GGDEF domain-containing phosphodiesterase [Synechococcus sp. HK05]MBV2351197.1 EAL domain-containing protein [Synechococcus sp. HK05]
MALLEEAERLQHCGSWRIDHGTGAVLWSPQTYRILDTDPHLSASFEGLLERVHPDDRNLVAASVRQSWLSGQPFRLEHRLQLTNERIALVLHRGETICDDDGKALYSIGTLQSLTLQRNLQLELEQATRTDAITGLPNRLASIAYLEQRIRELPYNRQVAILCLDLDNFQSINDSFGVEVGNQLLHWSGDYLRQQLQASDWLARLDSDTFLVVRSEHVSSLAEALQLAEQLQRSLHQVVPRLEAPLPIQMSACVGVSIAPDHGSDASSLLQWANTALTEAKRQGKGAIRAYSTALSQRIRETLDLEQRLARAIDRQELHLHYQPQWDREQRLIGAEALLRWHTHRGEAIPPDRFIPLAEQSGLIRPLGRWVLEQGIAQLSHWQRKGWRLPRLAINVSGHQLDPGEEPLDQHLLSLCEQWQVLPEHLEVELTETALISNPEAAAHTLQTLAAAGVSLAIDDFGTGFSSLASLQRLPLQRLKIDRCFVQDLPNNSADRSIVKATILMAHELGLSCLAEGVETESQREQLLQLGCDSFQGYLLGKPMPAEELEAFIGAPTAPSPMGPDNPVQAA